MDRANHRYCGFRCGKALQVAQYKVAHFYLDTVLLCDTFAGMKKKPSSANPVTTIRFTPEDHKLIEDLAKKLGGSLPSVLRQGLRVLAAKEGISA
jgi:hypothetical protein